jgi:hypothetical protein
MTPSFARNNGETAPHGGPAHDAAINKQMEEARAAGAENIRKNQVQVNIEGNRVGNNKPDLQYDLNDTHYNHEFDTTEASSLKHQDVVPKNDPAAVNTFGRTPK